MTAGDTGFDIVVDAVDRRRDADGDTAGGCNATRQRIDAGGITRPDQHPVRVTATVEHPRIGTRIDIVAGIGENGSGSARTGTAERQGIDVGSGERLDTGIGAACQIHRAVADPGLTHLSNRADCDRSGAGTAAGALHVTGEGFDIDLAASYLDRQFTGTVDIAVFNAGRLFASHHVDCDGGADCGSAGTAATQRGGAYQRIAATAQIQGSGQSDGRLVNLRHSFGKDDVIDVRGPYRSGSRAIDNRTKAPDGAVPFRCRQRQVTHVVELAIDNLCPLLAIKNIGGGRAVNGYRTGTATGNSDRIDRLLHTALEADIGKAINQAAASDHCAAISGNAVDRRSKTHRSGTAAGNRAGQRSDGQALTCAGIQ